MQIASSLLEKYNVAVPRYTSYPTVPYWENDIDLLQWQEDLTRQFTLNNTKEGISLYIHLPFCEKLCTYCGCNKKITMNHSVEDEYMKMLIKEWHLYLELMNSRPVIRELHLGGGTPTFFSPENLTRLLNSIFEKADIHAEHEFSFEGHPNNTSPQHLQALYNLEFRRVSYGVQDNDPIVQHIINRIQPFENVQKATETARAIGYKSVNFDLIYGLPKQTLATMEKTILQSISLKPDRVAFYSYAHVPWTSRGQRLFDVNDLPSPELKMQLYKLGKKLFLDHGYHDIGMDHFALPADDLYTAKQEGRLHRNFMGYTTQRTAMLIGLGVSSISDVGVAFAQNEKTIHDYYAAINQNKIPVQRGYFLNKEDLAFRQYILNISCRSNTVFHASDLPELKKYSFPELNKLEQDGLIIWNEKGLEVTEIGRHFIRNICSAFDLHKLRSHKNTNTPIYSKAI